MEGRSASARWGHDGYLNREHSRIESEGKTSRRSQISFTSRMLIRIREHEEIKRKDSIGAVRPIEEGQAYQASTAARHHIDFLSIFRIRPLTRTKKKRKNHERPTETELQDEHFAFRTWLGATTKTSEACYLFRIPFDVFDHYMEYKHHEKNYKDVSSAGNNQGRSPMRNVSESHEREMTRKEQHDFAEQRSVYFFRRNGLSLEVTD
jgi:hypothetical protein